MSRVLRRFLKILLLLIGFIVLGAVVISATLGDAIGRRIISEVNNNLTTELQVGDVSLSLLRHFPTVAADLEQVVLYGTNDDVLLEAEALSFRFGLLSLFGDAIKVKKVVAQNGALSVQIDRKGRGNYEVFKTSEASSSSESSLGIDLQEAALEDIELLYQDEQLQQTLAALVRQASFSGAFDAKKFDLASDAALEMRFLEANQQRFLAGKAITYDADLNVDMDLGRYTIQELLLGVNGSEFRIDGSVITQANGHQTYDLALASTDNKLSSIVQLLPEEMLEQIGGLESTGRLSFDVLLSGTVPPGQQPEIKAFLALADGKITSPKLEGPIKDVTFEARFTNGAQRNNATSALTLKNFTGYFLRERVEINLAVNNLDQPVIDLDIDGKIPLGQVYPLLNNPRITDASGEIEIEQVRIKGNYADMVRPSRIGRVNTSGSLSFDDAELELSDEKLVVDRGRLRMEDNKFVLEDLQIEGAGSELTLAGNANNLLPVLLADSLNSQDAKLTFSAQLDAELLDLDRLLALSGGTTAETLEEASEPMADSLRQQAIERQQRLTNLLQGSFKATVDEFNYDLIEGEKFVGLIRFENNEVTIKGKTEAMEGQFDLNGTMNLAGAPQLEARLIAENVEAKEFFRQAENFGQEVLEARHLKGKMNAKMAIFAFWDEYGEFQQDKLRVLAGLGIEDGELKDFELLESFSTFVKVRDLKNIRFTNLQNFFEFKKNQLYIPAMFIQSNALNLTLSGQHSVDQDIAYYLKVNAGQVLTNKLFKSYDPSLKPVPARKRGTFNLHYSILGTLDDYSIKASRKRVRQNFEESDRRRQRIQRELEKIFGQMALVNEPQDWQDTPDFDDGGAEDEYFDFEIEGGK